MVEVTIWKVKGVARSELTSAVQSILASSTSLFWFFTACNFTDFVFLGQTFSPWADG